MAKKKWLHYPQRIEAKKEEEDTSNQILFLGLHIFVCFDPFKVLINKMKGLLASKKNSDIIRDAVTGQWYTKFSSDLFIILQKQYKY